MQNFVVEMQVTVAYTVPGQVKKKELEKLRELALADVSCIVREVGTYAGIKLVDLQLRSQGVVY